MAPKPQRRVRQKKGKDKNLIFKLSVLQAKAGMKPILSAASYTRKGKAASSSSDAADAQAQAAGTEQQQQQQQQQHGANTEANPHWNRRAGLIAKVKERTWVMRLSREAGKKRLAEQKNTWSSEYAPAKHSWTIRQNASTLPEGREAVEAVVEEAQKPVDLEQYWAVYEAVGGPWWWHSHARTAMSEQRLKTLLAHEQVSVFYIKHNGQAVGMVEIWAGSSVKARGKDGGSVAGDGTAAAAMTPELAEAIGVSYPLPEFNPVDAWTTHPDGKGQVEVKYFGLVPEAAGAGLGKLAMTWVQSHVLGKSKTIKSLWLSTSCLDSPDAKAFYEGCGFVEDGTWDEETVDPRAIGIYPPNAPHHQADNEEFFFWGPVKGEVADKITALTKEIVARKIHYWKKVLLGRAVKKARSHSLQALRGSVKRLEAGAKEGAAAAAAAPEEAKEEMDKAASELAARAAERAKDAEELIHAKMEDLVADAWTWFRRGRGSVEDLLEDARSARKLVKVDNAQLESRWKKLLWSQSQMRKAWKEVEEQAEKLMVTLDRSSGVSVAAKTEDAGFGDDDGMYGEEDDGGSGGSSDEGGAGRGRRGQLEQDKAYWEREMSGKSALDLGDDVGMKKKNRMGQRARQRLAEARFGRSANHLRGETRRAFYGGLPPVNAKGTRAAQLRGSGSRGEEDVEMEEEQQQQQQAPQRGRVTGEKRKASREPEPEEEVVKKAKTAERPAAPAKVAPAKVALAAGADGEALHPSWAAKRAAAAKAAVVFEGTKTKFELSDDED